MLSSHKEDIEELLYLKCKDQRVLFNECDVVLYDLTTLRFESVRKDLGKLHQFGYSKEIRSDCTQVVLGLMVDKNGMPIGFDVYPGNTFEGTTVSDMISKLSQKFQIRRFILVGDRGLFSRGNLDYIHKQKQEFIMGLKLDLLKGRQDEIYNLKNFRFINNEEGVRWILRGTNRSEIECFVFYKWSACEDQSRLLVKANTLDRIG